MNAILRPLATLLVAGLLCTDLSAQGVLIPEQDHDGFVLPRHGRVMPPDRTSYRIERISIDAKVRDQIARTSVSQTFRNTGSRQLQVSFVFPLPYDGAVDKLTFMVGDKELKAKLMDAEKARQIYQGYVRRNQDPALLELIGTGMFKTSIFPIPAGESRTVTLEYSQLLRKEGNAIDYLFPLATAQYTSQPIEELSIRLAVTADEDLKNIYSPTHDVKIERDDDRNAVVTYARQKTIPSSDFRLVYGTDNQEIGANVISYWPSDQDEGYFVLLASPKIKQDMTEKQSKNIVFVVDRSGSMRGKKIEQAREAAKYVLNNLNKGDLFNVIAYDTDIDSFVPELERYEKETRSRGIGFINSVHSGGSTNIDGALEYAMSSITDDSNPSYIVFLTDGLPTAGETDEMKIVENATDRNKFRARLISFGVGYDVNSRLIDRLTRRNFGQSEFVRPDEDIEATVSRLFQKISSPVMTDVAVSYEFDEVPADFGNVTNRIYPTDAFDLFANQQLVVVGRYRKSGDATIKLKGRVGDKKTKFKFDVQFAAKGQGTANKYVEQLWAARRIGEIIDLIDLNGRNKELIEELVELSKKHGIVTPYTSFLADENADASRLADMDLAFDQSGEELEMLEMMEGESGFSQRKKKGAFKGAKTVPHPSSSIPGLEDVEMDVITGLPIARDMQSGLRKTKRGTLYKRGSTLFAENAADVDLEKATIIEVARFSDEYFELVAANTPDENELMSAQRDGEELIIRLRQKIYRIK